MRRIAVLLLFFAATASGQTLSVDGFFTARGMNASGPQTWLLANPPEHVGRMLASDTVGFGIAQVGLNWEPSVHFGAHIDGIARREPSGYGGRRAGLVEAYVDARAGGLTIRAGQFFLGTSRENTDVLWNSPYTMNYSAINSWIGEEFRPVGIDASYKVNMLTVGATAFRNNDTMGTELAWRGWDIGNRLSVYNETLPVWVPPVFHGFQKPGTRPFEKDLHGKTGYAARARVNVPDRGVFQFTHVDNRGDRRLYNGDYSWATHFNQIGAQAGNVDTTTLAAEWMRGTTKMGFRPFPVVEDRFSAAYLLVSHVMGKNRFSARYDWFTTTDLARVVAETYDERGRSWTLSAFHDVTPHLRAGAEFTQVTGRRDDAFDGRSVSVELRYWLHR
jgi:hypothetical protein